MARSSATRRLSQHRRESDPGLPPYDTMPNGRLLVGVDEPLPADALAPVLVVNWASAPQR